MSINRSAPERSHWSNRWAFIIATTGSAIGLGNIWKFPYMAGEGGGSAFVIVYLACVALVGVPLMMTEVMLGRRGQCNPVNTMTQLAREAGTSSWWCVVGVMGVLTGVVILSFYSVVAGWMLDYLVRCFAGELDGITAEEARTQFAAFLADPQHLLAWHSVFIAMTAVVVGRGVTQGLERANTIMMPALGVILVILLGYGAAEGNMGHAADFMFSLDFSKITPSVVLSAMGQAFFTLSLGMGAVMTYGSYLQRGVSIARTTFAVAAADTIVALLAGLAIFSIVFAHGLAPAAGPGLVMQTLPIAFGNMPGGRLAGTLFFLLVTFAAWTSSISLLEPATAWLSENTRLSRVQASLMTAGTAWLVGVAVALSFSDWRGFTVFGLGIFDLLDYLTSNILLPLGGLLMAIFAGWFMKQADERDELGLDGPIFDVWRFTVRYFSPVAILLIFLNVTGLLPKLG